MILLALLVMGRGHPSLAGGVEGNVRLHVTDVAGRPVGGAQVRVPVDAEPVITGDDGIVEVEVPAAGRYHVRITAAGFRAQTYHVDLEPGAEPVTLVLDRPEFRQEVQVTGVLPDLVAEDTLPRDEIDTGETSDLGAALRYHPGLEAFQRGGTNLDPTVRGLQEAEIAMLVDGTRTFAAGPARMDSDLSHVALHDVDQVQVVRGPYALAWGAGAMSAVQVDTYRPEFSIGKARFEGTATLVYGENASSLDAYARLGGATPQFRWTASGNVRSAGDYTDGDDQPVAAGYDSDNWRWGIGGKLADDVTLDYAGGYQEQRDVEYPGRILDATYFKTLSHALELRWRPPSGYLAELYGQAYLNDKTHEMNNDEKPTAQADPDRTPPFPLEIVLPTTSDTSGARFYAVLGRQRLQWKVGTDYYGLDQTATREVSNRDTGAVLFEDIVWPDATTMDLGLYGQVTWTATRYQVTGIVRGDFVDSDAGETSQFFLDSTQGDLDRSDTNLSAAVSGSVNLSKHWTLEAGAGRAVRSPTHLELYSDRFPAVKFQTSAEFLGNPELEPEVSLQGDAGVRATYGSFDFSVDGFWRRIDDYITVVPDPDVPKRLPLSPDTVFRYINGEATFYGGELRLSQVLRSGFGYRGWASYVHGQDDLLDEPALGIPPLMGEVAISYRKAGVRGFWIELGMLMAARQERVATTRFETETSGWTVFNLRTTWDVSGVVQVVAGIDNLANRQYSDHLNALDPFQGGRIPAQGRNFYIGLNFFF